MLYDTKFSFIKEIKRIYKEILDSERDSKKDPDLFIYDNTYIWDIAWIIFWRQETTDCKKFFRSLKEYGDKFKYEIYKNEIEINKKDRLIKKIFRDYTQDIEEYLKRKSRYLIIKLLGDSDKLFYFLSLNANKILLDYRKLDDNKNRENSGTEKLKHDGPVEKNQYFEYLVTYTFSRYVGQKDAKLKSINSLFNDEIDSLLLGDINNNFANENKYNCKKSDWSFQSLIDFLSYFDDKIVNCNQYRDLAENHHYLELNLIKNQFVIDRKNEEINYWNILYSIKKIRNFVSHPNYFFVFTSDAFLTNSNNCEDIISYLEKHMKEELKKIADSLKDEKIDGDYSIFLKNIQNEFEEYKNKINLKNNILNFISQKNFLVFLINKEYQYISKLFVECFNIKDKEYQFYNLSDDEIKQYLSIRLDQLILQKSTKYKTTPNFLDNYKDRLLEIINSTKFFSNKINVDDDDEYYKSLDILIRYFIQNDYQLSYYFEKILKNCSDKSLIDEVFKNLDEEIQRNNYICKDNNFLWDKITSQTMFCRSIYNKMSLFWVFLDKKEFEILVEQIITELFSFNDENNSTSTHTAKWIYKSLFISKEILENFIDNSLGDDKKKNDLKNIININWK